jgi:hypothetical protein
VPPSEALRRAIAARAEPATASADAREVASALARAGGESVRAALFFGSRKTRAAPDPWSAYDLFVIVDGYWPFYRHLRSVGATSRSPVVMAALNHCLAPNVISFSTAPGPEGPRRAKCAVLTAPALRRETSAGRHDHFCMGRLFQPAEIVYVADEAARQAVVDALTSAAALTYSWVRPWLPERFDVETYARTLLRVSLSREIRPEPAGRAEALGSAQREHLVAIYGILLEDLAAAGELVRDGDGYRVARPAQSLERLGKDLYFRWSTVRATLRWFKYMVTFQDWLEYIVRKAQRHTGRRIELTSRERRFPLIFLWPRLVDYLRHKDRWGRQP